MRRIIEPLELMGATIQATGGKPPLVIRGTKAIRPINYKLPVASAQVKSAILFAALRAEGRTQVHESSLSRDHTERMFRYLGIPFKQEGTIIEIEGRPSVGWTSQGTLCVPGDLSSAAFFLVGASLLPGSDVTIPNVGVNLTRTGILDVLTQMGADIELMNTREQAGEPVADLRVRAGKLHGVRVGREQIPRTIDEFPILCVAAALADGETVISGAEELRVKESDRIATMATELKKFGVAIQETPDGLVIQGTAGGALRGASSTSYGDHRVAMSLAIAGLVADAPTLIEDTACIETSFPGFDAERLKLLTLSGRSL